jgi:hypothetical protein
VLHIARNYIEHLAADVDRAIFQGTIQTCVGGIGGPDFQPGSGEAHLAVARKFDAYVNAWGYTSAALYGTKVIAVTDAKLRTDAKAYALSLRKHLDLGGRGGGISIVSECNDKWGCKATDYIQAFEDVAGIVRDQCGDAFAPGWGLSSLMALSNAASFRPPSAKWFDLHAYGVKSVAFSVLEDGSLKPNSQQAARLLTLCEMATAMGLPIGVGECGVIDIPDIDKSGKAVWTDYYGRLIGGSPAGVDLAVRYGFAFVGLFSQNWTPYPNWLDGRWAPGLTHDEAVAVYGPNPPPLAYGYPGCPEACTVMKKKLLATPTVVKGAPSPFKVTAVGPVAPAD